MLKSEVAGLLKSAGVDTTEDKLEIPPQDDFGDVSFPCFEFSKAQKKNPNEIAKSIRERIVIPKSSAVARVDVKAGYVNFFFDWGKVAGGLLGEISRKGGDYGKSDMGKGNVAIVDYSSPNPVHPIHVGSARSTLIGESLCRILEEAGYDAKRLLFINDLGRQVAILLWHYLKHMKGAKPDKKEDHWLLDIYVKANKELKDNPEYEREVEQTLNKCEFGDKDMMAVLRTIVEWCLSGFGKTYETLGIKFDERIWESSFVEKAKLYVSSLLRDKAAFTTADDAVVIDLERYGMPSTVILRRDGTTLYLTRDVAASIYKIEKYKPTLNVYVVSEEQSLHFRQEFKVLELLGYKSYVSNSHHLAFGYVSLPEGKMSSRLGRVVLLDDLIDEATSKVKEKFDVSDEKVARAIGLGAVIYSILKVEAKKQVMFRWEDVLSLEGNSAPYVQYAYARCCSILEKAGDWDRKFSAGKLTVQEEKLLKALVSFGDVARQAARELRPDIMCNYAFELATRFNTFYQFCSVLNADSAETKNFRLILVESVKTVLGIVLGLLDIEKVEKV